MNSPQPEDSFLEAIQALIHDVTHIDPAAYKAFWEALEEQEKARGPGH